MQSHLEALRRTRGAKDIHGEIFAATNVGNSYHRLQEHNTAMEFLEARPNPNPNSSA